MTGRSVALSRRSTMGASSSGPSEQLTPSASTPSPSNRSATISGVEPVSVRAPASNVTVAYTGLSECSFRASTQAFNSYRSEKVSTIYPPTMSEVRRAISANASYASSKVSVPTGARSAPVGPRSKNTSLPAARAFSTAARTSVSSGYFPLYLIRFSPKELAEMTSAPASAYAR